jgi:hypothetical protein
MTMVYASPPPRRARIRDSEAEVETRVYVRRRPHATQANVFLQPWTPADPVQPWMPSVPRVESQRAESQRADSQPAESDETPAPASKRRRRSMMPLVLFLAAFGLAFGVGRDRTLRSELVSELRVATATAVTFVETSAMRLGRQGD